jgi:prefoldin subunit 5
MDSHHRHRSRRLDLRKAAPSDGPPHLSPVDKIIDLHHGTTTAIEASRERLQASKEYSEPSSAGKIEQLQEQYRIRYHEAVYFRQMEPSRREFKDDVSRVSRQLAKRLHKLDEIDRSVDQELAELRERAPPSPVDKIISLYQDFTTATQTSQGYEQCAESASQETIEQLQRQIGRLSEEVASFRQAEPYVSEFRNEVALAARGLEESVSKLGKAQRSCEQKLYQ